MGGGAHATPDPMPSVSAVCHRDITLGIVFDCFYKPEGLQDAVRLQEEINGLLGEFSGDQEVRMEGVSPDAGHWIMEENPKATIALVRAFLERSQ